MNQEDCIRFRKSCEIESPRFLESDRNSRHISVEKQFSSSQESLQNHSLSDLDLENENKNDAPTRITEDGIKEWLDNDGKRHRDGDQPAQIWTDGSKLWYVHGKLHREGDQPAIIRANGSKAW